MKEKIFELISTSPIAISGAAIGSALGVSRVAINKHVHALIDRGIKIDCSTNVGYTYIPSDTLDEITLSARLKSKDINVKVVSVDSTNTWAKNNCAEIQGNSLIVAPMQFSGKGRMGRKFSSDVGGVYMTFVKSFENLMITDSLNVVLLAGLAVARMLKSYDIDAKIKWPNDVYVNGKKISGILLESSCSEGKIDKLFLGIGINVNNDLKYPINEIAIGMKELLGKEMYREEIISLVVEELNNLIDNYLAYGQDSFIDEYMGLSMTVGRKVSIVDAFGASVEGQAVGMSTLGYLKVEVDGIIREVIAGDVFPVESDND